LRSSRKACVIRHRTCSHHRRTSISVVIRPGQLPETTAVLPDRKQYPKRFLLRYQPPSSAPSPPQHSSSDANWVPCLQKKTPLRNKALHSAWFLTRPAAQETLTWRFPKQRRPVGKVVMYSSVSVDGFIADENDRPGPLFDWLLSGDVPLDESGTLKVSQTSYDYIRPYWDQIGATIVGRHVFDLTNGWDGTPPAGVDHVVVVTHRGRPEGWYPEAPFHFVDGIEAAVAKAQELAGDRVVEVAAGEVGGQVFAAGTVDEVRMDVVPAVFGTGKRYFGSVDAQHLLEDPDVVIQGNRVLHLRCRVRR